MRFMMIVKANRDSEAGKMPPEELLAAMGKYNEELMKAGALIDLAGLQPTSKGARVQFSGGKTLVIDGPFAETKDLIEGIGSFGRIRKRKRSNGRGGRRRRMAKDRTGRSKSGSSSKWRI
jgi:hypothetical protein